MAKKKDTNKPKAAKAVDRTKAKRKKIAQKDFKNVDRRFVPTSEALNNFRGPATGV